MDGWMDGSLWKIKRKGEREIENMCVLCISNEKEREREGRMNEMGNYFDMILKNECF